MSADITHNQMKLEILFSLKPLVDQVKLKIVILVALDGDSSTSGSGDLIDQITGLHQETKALEATIRNAIAVIPTTN